MREHTRKWLATILVFGLVATVGLGGCAPATPDAEEPAGEEITKGGTMSFYIGEPAYIDPYNAQESEGMQVTQVLFDSLTQFDSVDTSKLMPAAAAEWESNPDATVWTFKLQPEGKFSDGSPVTAADFVYAWNRIANPETKNTLTGEADPSVISYHLGFVKGFAEVADGKAAEMEGVKAIDDLTLEVTLTQSFADFPFVVAHPALAPVKKEIVESGVDVDGKTIPFGDMPVGNGPFKMAEPWAHNQYIKVAKNENFYGTEPNIDGVDFRIFKDPETAFTEFEAGNLDFTMIGEGKIQDTIAKYGESPNGYTVNPGEQVLLGPETATYYLIFNMEDDVLKNENVRKAVSLAINRQAICDVVFEGTRDPADNIIPPGVTGYKAGAWPDTVYDVEAAKKALADAGYPEGKGLDTIRLGFNSGGGHEKIMELVASDLKAIGIQTRFESADFPVYLKQLDEGKHQIARLGWIADYPIAYNFLYPLFESNSGDNKSAFSNADVDKAIAEGQTILDDAARATKYGEISATIATENPVAPLMFYKHTRVGSERLRDFTFDAMGFGDFTKVWITQ